MILAPCRERFSSGYGRFSSSEFISRTLLLLRRHLPRIEAFKVSLVESLSSGVIIATCISSVKLSLALSRTSLTARRQHSASVPFSQLLPSHSIMLTHRQSSGWTTRRRGEQRNKRFTTDKSLLRPRNREHAHGHDAPIHSIV